MTTGRPTKLDDLTSEKIIDALAGGGTRRAAAAAAKVHVSTLQDWLARGRAGEVPFSDFSDRVRWAEAEAEMIMVGAIRKAALSGSWQAAAWWLERRRPERYGLRREPKALPPMTEEQARAKYREITGHEWGSPPSDDVAVLESLLAAARSRKEGA